MKLSYITANKVLLPLMLLISVFLTSCGEQSESAAEAAGTLAQSTDSTATTGSDQAAIPLLVYDREGTARTIYLDANTSAVVMATWCPYSQELVDMLNDSALIKKLPGLNVVFLFEQNEWPQLLRKLDKDTELAASVKVKMRQKIAAKMSEPGQIHVLDPTKLDQLPGEVYFFNRESNIEFTGFPGAYLGKEKNFTLDRITWLEARSGMNSEEFAELYKRHAIANDTTENIASR